MEIDSEALADRPHVWRLDVRGELDLATAHQLDEAIQHAVDEGARTVLLDLGAVSFLDSSGMRSIVQASQRLEEQGGRVAWIGLSPAAERIFDLTGVLERLPRLSGRAHLTSPSRRQPAVASLTFVRMPLIEGQRRGRDAVDHGAIGAGSARATSEGSRVPPWDERRATDRRLTGRPRWLRAPPRRPRAPAVRTARPPCP